MHNSLAKILGLVAWVVTALAAINVGLLPFGYDFFKLPFVQNNIPQLVTPLYYLIGVAGVVSLVLFFMACTSGCCMCGGCKDHAHRH